MSHPADATDVRLQLDYVQLDDVNRRPVLAFDYDAISGGSR
jgi:hypothetical protein